MADPLQPVVPGQTVRLTAAAWNEFLSGAARARRLERLGGEAQTAPPVPSVILLKNTTNAAIDRHGVLSIASVAPLVTPTTSTPVFESAVALEGDLPAAAGERFAIMLDPLPATNSIGRAAVGGMVQALVNVSNTSHAYATTAASNTVALASNASHGAPIVWKESGTGVKWSIIALPAQHGGSGAIDGTLTNGTIPVATDPDTVGDSWLSQDASNVSLAANKTFIVPSTGTLRIDGTYTGIYGGMAAYDFIADETAPSSTPTVDNLNVVTFAANYLNVNKDKIKFDYTLELKPDATPQSVTLSFDGVDLFAATYAVPTIPSILRVWGWLVRVTSTTFRATVSHHADSNATATGAVVQYTDGSTDFTTTNVLQLEVVCGGVGDIVSKMATIEKVLAGA